MPKTASEVSRLWARFEAQLTEHAPLIRKSLNSPTTEQQIREFEKLLGLPLPLDLRQSLFVHNGQLPKVESNDGKRLRRVPVRLFNTESFLSVERISAVWTMMRDIPRDDDLFEAYKGEWPGFKKDSRIKHAEYWNVKWIPITDSDGDGFCIDMDPAPGGRVGQVFYFCRGDHWPRKDGAQPWRVLAPDYTRWLLVLVELLDERNFRVETDGRSIRFEPVGILFTRLLDKNK